MRNHLYVVALTLLSLPAIAAVPPEAVELRNRGLAELENEKPELAEEAYRRLIEVAPEDPLGHGNLAIAELRQQKNDAAMASIERALALAPGRADLLAIKSEVLQWTGDLEGALAVMKQAADAAPQDLEIQYAAYQLATTVRTEEADAAGLEVLRRLAKLRPENLVVLLQLGQRAIAAGDRRVASGVFVRVEQLLWQVDPIATRALGMVTEALAADDLSAARVPAIRLENVLKVSAMYRESLRELKTGIQGIPIKRFVDEPEASDFGDPVASDDYTFCLYDVSGGTPSVFVKSGGCNGEEPGTLHRYDGTAPGGTWQQVTRAGAGRFGVYAVDHRRTSPTSPPFDHPGRHVGTKLRSLTRTPGPLVEHTL